MAMPDLLIEGFKLTAYDVVDVIKDDNSDNMAILKFVKVEPPAELAEAS
jgi:hypothetical protein